ncbi:hypothetical protein ABIC83_002595 [Roseateles asaccharophilus]|uniref:type II toxin-antitoxin system HipA family toxin n=1 Tax=Roseateles asaccharophilus TaxID=582607 RepID=UPI00383777C1
MSSNLKQIFVSLDFNGKTHPVGVIRYDPKENFGYFTYLKNYTAPPLDPINLNYRAPVDPQDRLRRGERVFVVDLQVSPGLMHQVFCDAMPGHWGMAVLQAEYPEIRQMRDAERLHWMGARTTGALSFFVEQRADEKPVVGLEELEVVRQKCMQFMSRLEKMGLAGVRNPAVASHGGVMPKASYEDAQGRHWIAKFDKPGDGIQTTIMEHTASLMAARCGVAVPVTKVMMDKSDGNVFLSERFDRDLQGRHHKASFMTLLGVADAGRGDYRDMFRVLRRIVTETAWPAQRDELLRRLAVNVGLNVTDDHLRNHEVRLMDTGEWELAPAFDIVPVSGRSPHQAAIFGHARADINLSNPKSAAIWARAAEEIGVEQSYAFGIIGQVAKTIEEHWPALVESSGMNRVNQSFALMATEVGCGIDFPGKAQTLQPLDDKAKKDLGAVAFAAGRAMAIFSGAPVDPDELNKLSRALVRLSVESNRLAHVLRSAGYNDSAELLLAASLSAASNALLEGKKQDPRGWLELEAVSSNLTAVLNGKQPPQLAADPGRRPGAHR